MRKTKEILRLKFEAGLGNRDRPGARHLGLHGLGDRRRASGRRAHLAAPARAAPRPSSKRRLYRAPRREPQPTPREPDWARVQTELRAQARHPAPALGGVQGRAPGRLRVQLVLRALPGSGRQASTCVMRQEHTAGEKLFVDWAGDTHRRGRSGDAARSAARTSSWPCSGPPTTPTPRPARDRDAARLPRRPRPRASRSSAASRSCSVPDNLKTGVTKPDRYEPDINRAPTPDLADHYGCCGAADARPSAPRQGQGRGRRASSPSGASWRRLRQPHGSSVSPSCNAAIAAQLATTRTSAPSRSSPAAAQSSSRRRERRLLRPAAGRALRATERASGPACTSTTTSSSRPLLLGALPAGPRDRSSCASQRDGRGLPQGRAGRRARARRPQGAGHDRHASTCPSPHRR